MKYFAMLVGLVASNPIVDQQIWHLRSVKDHQKDSDLQIAFGDGATKDANEDAQNKSEKVGYEMGDYAFVETPYGGLYVQTSAEDLPITELRSVQNHAAEAATFSGFVNHSGA